jgi:glycerophosphoryl diester phosphodiesterase
MGPGIIVLLTVAGIAILLILVYGLILVRPGKKKAPDPALLCDYAHRGLYDGKEIPENSMAAFEKACQSGVGIELDVQLSKDRKVMVFHDYTLERMTGKEALVGQTDAEVLKGTCLGGTEERIPTLEEVLKLVDGRVPLLIEMKGESTDATLCKYLAEVLECYQGKYCIESFNPMLIREIKKWLPNAFCGLLYTDVCRDKKKRSVLNVILTCMALNVLARPHFIAYNQEDRRSLPVRLATGLYGAPRFVWTIRTDATREDAHARGECAIFEQER